LLQAGLPVLAGGAIARAASEGPDSPVSPAGYAFAIWGPIFFLCLAYALYQALPSNREQPLLRRVGWASAGAFFGNGLWEIVVPLRQFVLAQALLVGVFICAGVAYLPLMRSERGVVGTADRWLVVPPLGLLFGWITAANPVSLASEAVRLGLVGSGGTTETLLGVALLLLGGLLASAVLRAGRGGPLQGHLAYAMAVL
jgi:hypothetical protein